MSREESVIRPEIREEDRDPALRPQYFDEFLGQAPLKENLHIFISAAKVRKEPLDHVFLSGPPGLGKTTLAGIISKELGVDFRQTNAPALDKPKDLVGILSSIPERCVVFIDEIHRLKPAMEEMLYIAMEDYGLDIIIGQGPAARTIRVPIKPFTLIGATTKPGKVSQPLYSRFGIHLRMEYYSPEDLLKILRRSSKILGIEVEEDGALLLASCSRGTPRIANRLLRRLRDFSQVKGKGAITKDLVISALNRLEVDRSGLEKQDREILRTIIEKFKGGPVGAETLAISVSESIDTLEDFYEPYLIQMGFLQRTPRGRMATALAYQHLGLDELMKEQRDADQRFFF